MTNFDRICEAIGYIEDHLGEKIGLLEVAQTHHLSPHYFHRLFSVLVGKPLATHIRERRMEKAGRLLLGTTDPLGDIGASCGFDSYPAFCRAFKSRYGMSPRVYRRAGRASPSESRDQIITRLRARLQGGVLMVSKVIERGKMLIAGISGDGSQTAQVWERFMTQNEAVGLPNRLSDNGYEIRVYGDGATTVQVGLLVSDGAVDPVFTVMELPASKYASFQVFVAKGYDSGNAAMDQWLKDHEDTYRQRMLGGTPYVVEYYDERFRGDEADSIVEIWVPILSIG